MNGRLAFLTLEDRSGYVIDDELAIAELGRRGLRAEEVPWPRDVDWRAFDGVVIRTTWDYHLQLDRFLARLDELERLGVPVANDVRLVRWNARKSYLRDLAARGVPIVPTRFGRGLSVAQLRAVLAEISTDECVLKPLVSANAWDTFRLSPRISDEEAARVAGRFADREFMAQPFLTRVLDDGEHSIFSFGGEISHAVVKRPRSGDFRVQEEHGGQIVGEPLTPELRSAAERALRALDSEPLQARIDLVRLDDGSLALMELELIEPALYLRTHPDAPACFADAVERWLSRARTAPSRAAP